MFLRNGFQESEYHASFRAARFIESRLAMVVSKRVHEAQSQKAFVRAMRREKTDAY
jgi:hypothetical protein